MNKGSKVLLTNIKAQPILDKYEVYVAHLKKPPRRTGLDEEEEEEDKDEDEEDGDADAQDE
ncbi:hypothetical protein BGX38DRAFT_1265926 [Terfezia claveryi]|nr:hypothetical protein BGX38DRAFT_1265926 [Terfezia claveryi]